MKNKPVHKTLGAKTGKDILNLFKSKEQKSNGFNGSVSTDESEIKLFAIWAGLLGHENFGFNDDFFQIGGNSLKGIQIISRVSNLFQVNIQLTDIFLYPTITQLAAFIRVQQKEISLSKGIVASVRPERIPLSYNQERLWFIDQLEGSVAYHIPAVLRLKGILNKNAINFAFSQIVNRHEILRTVIRQQNGQGYQVVQDPNQWSCSEFDETKFTKGYAETVRELMNAPFDLAKDNMIRVNLIRVSENEHVVVLVLHHIAADGWSASIIVREFIELYRTFERNKHTALTPLTIQYADFAIWQRHALQESLMDKQLSYWKEKLQAPMALQLPTDNPRSAVQSFEGALEKFVIDKKLTEQLQFLGNQHGSTLFMVLLTALKILLYRYTSQPDISVGTAIAGRRQQELEGLIGFFVNTLALRSHLITIGSIKHVKRSPIKNWRRL